MRWFGPSRNAVLCHAVLTLQEEARARAEAQAKAQAEQRRKQEEARAAAQKRQEDARKQAEVARAQKLAQTQKVTAQKAATQKVSAGTGKIGTSSANDAARRKQVGMEYMLSRTMPGTGTLQRSRCPAATCCEQDVVL